MAPRTIKPGIQRRRSNNNKILQHRHIGVLNMAWYDTLNFPCEGVVLNYKPFADEPSHNVNIYVQSKKGAMQALKKYSGYDIVFGIRINGDESDE